MHGLRHGATQIILTFVSGVSIYRYAIGEVIVGPCVPSALTLNTHVERIREGAPVTLTAMTTGSSPLHVEWHEGETLLGVGNPMTFFSLSSGAHRITARVANACGAAEEQVIVVVGNARRRTVRRLASLRRSSSVATPCG